MHEMGIAQNILEISIEAARKENASKITGINLIIGELRGIVPLQLTFCLEIMSKNTIAEGASVKIETVPLHGMCNSCNTNFSIEDYAYLCPNCNGVNIKITSGDEFTIKDIEID